MKTTIIPAQITTVEDTIAGNLNLTQILLLLGMLFYITFVYAVLPEKFHFTGYKIPLIIFGSIFIGIFALRIKGRIVLSWFMVLARYFLRPGHYLFDKNTTYLRQTTPPLLQDEKTPATISTAHAKKQHNYHLSFPDMIKIEGVIRKQKTKFRFRFGTNGGMHVSVQ